MNTRRHLTALTLLVCMVLWLKAHPSWNRTWEEDNIREAIFRHYQPTGKEIYVLSVLDKDPSEALMQRFPQTDHLLTKSQYYTLLMKTRGRVHAVYTNTEAITWLSDMEVAVGASCIRGPLDAEGGTFYLHWEWGRWVIKRFRCRWVS